MNRAAFAGWVRLVAMAALLSAACTSPSTGHVTSASRTTTPAVTGNPVVPHACSQLSNPCLALVTLRGSNQFVIRDITDINHPKTLSTLNKISPQFISSTDVSYVEDNTLIRKRWAEPTQSGLASSSQGIGVFAWSPDGSTAVYATQPGSGAQVHQLRPTGDRVLGSLPPGGLGGCEAIASCGIVNTLDYQLSYSPDGTTISLVANLFNLVVFRVWSADGKLLRSADSQDTTMSVWAGTGLYFRDPSGVHVFRNGTVSTFLSGVAWFKPKASPGGNQIVYTARDASGWGHVYVVDTVTKNVHELKAARSNAVFLTSRYIWYRGERACVAADQCGSNPPFHPFSGKTYVYDLQDGTETESIITSVQDIWPHAA
jgi:hypothetical protein